MILSYAFSIWKNKNCDVNQNSHSHKKTQKYIYISSIINLMGVHTQGEKYNKMSYSRGGAQKQVQRNNQIKVLVDKSL